MTNVQKENGFTPIAHELLQAIRAADFNATELKILIDVLDRTYGYEKKTAWFSGGYMATHLYLNERSARRAVQGLVDRKVLVKSTKTDGVHEQRHLGINKHYDQWDVVFAPAFAQKAAAQYKARVVAGASKRFSKNAAPCRAVGAQQPGGACTPPHVGAYRPPKQEDIKQEDVDVTRAREDVIQIVSDDQAPTNATAAFDAAWPYQGQEREVAALVREHGEKHVLRAIREAKRCETALTKLKTPIRKVASILFFEQERGYTFAPRRDAPPRTTARDSIRPLTAEDIAAANAA